MIQSTSPDYSTLLAEQWSETLNLIAKILNIPTALIMKLDGKEIKVFAKNNNDANPYQINDSETFDGSGLYCEHVIKHQHILEVNNALTDPKWDKNPDIKLNMIYYLGLPLNYSNGAPFGTICVLDSKERATAKEFKTLLAHIRTSMEQQLQTYELQQQVFEKKNLKHIENLICAMAHELNTPTGVSITAASVLTNQLNDLKQHFQQQTLSKTHFKEFFKQSEQCIELISSNLSKTSSLIERFRNISTQLSLNTKQVNLALFVADLEKSYQRCYHDQVIFKININEQTTLTTVPMLLQSVIGQLVDNAFEHAFDKHNDSDKVFISIDEIAHEVVFTVEDNGSGIEIDDPNDVFSPNIQLGHQQSHIGLGLCLVQKTVLEQLKGTIKLKSCHKGCLFEIRLPKLSDFK